MAISDLVPAFERSRKGALEKSSRVALQLIPGLKDQVFERASNRVFYGVLGAMLGISLVALLGINIALSNDAVQIRELKLEVIAISEAREEALREVTKLSTPENLAQRAKSLGMVPGREPIFIDLSANATKGDR
jgi:hypothetical protein